MITSREEKFFAAATHGELDEAEKIFAETKDSKLLNYVSNEKQTALHLAAWRGYKPVVDFLIEKGAKVDARDSRRRTPLLLAASYGYDEIAESLIKSGADINAQMNSGQTPLIYVIRENNGSNQERYNTCTRKLVERGADLNLQDQDGRTAIMFSAESQYRTENFDVLLAKKADLEKKDNQGKTVLLQLATRSSKYAANCFKKLVNHGANVNALDNNKKSVIDLLLEENAKENEVIKAKIQFLMDSKIAKLNPDLTTRALNNAFKNKSSAQASLLLDVGVKVPTDKALPETLYASYEMGLLEKVILTLELTAQKAEKMAADYVDAQGNTLLLRTIQDGKYAQAEKLMPFSNVHAQNKKGETPLRLACQKSNPALAAKLLDAGAKVDETDEKGRPLLARFLDETNIATLLIQRGANVEQELKQEGTTLLIKAVEEGNEAVVRAILARNPRNINAKNQDGRTALFLAVLLGLDNARKYVGIVQALLDANADASIQCKAYNNFDDTAPHLAGMHYLLSPILQAHAAKLEQRSKQQSSVSIAPHAAAFKRIAASETLDPQLSHDVVMKFN